MAIINMVIRRSGAPADSRLRKEAAEVWKRHGATQFRIGSIHSGAHTGQTIVVITFPDWTAYGKAMHSISEDADNRRIMDEVAKIGPIQERYVTVMDEV